MLTEILLDRFPISAITGNRQVMPGQDSKSSNTTSSTVPDQGPAATVSLSKEGVEKSKKANGKELSEEESSQVDELKKRDREVKQHEQAHLAAAGGYALGGPVYEYQNGPDGKRYAVGGHVNMDTSEEKTPEATLQKAAVLQKAATAAAEPSGQDRAVAAQAAQMAADARKEIAQEKSKTGSDNPAVKAYTSASRLGAAPASASLRAWIA